MTTSDEIRMLRELLARVEDERNDYKACAENWEANAAEWSRDWHALRDERDALAAHVDRLHSFIGRVPAGTGTCMCGAPMAGHPHDNHSPCDEWDYYSGALLSETLTTSLARLKAQWQAEALEGFADWLPSDYQEGEAFQSGIDQVGRLARSRAEFFRRQAEEGS